jgi:hypothetical protein
VMYIRGAVRGNPEQSGLASHGGWVLHIAWQP